MLMERGYTRYDIMSRFIRPHDKGVDIKVVDGVTMCRYYKTMNFNNIGNEHTIISEYIANETAESLNVMSASIVAETVLHGLISGKLIYYFLCVHQHLISRDT